MKRREFIAAAGVVAGLLFAASASAQVPGRVYRVATLSPIPKGRSSPDATVRDELARHGFIEKQNLILDLRGEGVSEAQMAVIARDLVESGTDAIYSVGDAATRVAAGATTTIPIVAMSDDLVASKLVASFAKPGGNVTGVSILAHELDGKRQDLLIELVPNMHRLALLSDPATTVPGHIEALIEAGRNRGVSVALYQAATAEEVPMALTSAKIDGGRRNQRPRRCALRRRSRGDHRAHRNSAAASDLPVATLHGRGSADRLRPERSLDYAPGCPAVGQGAAWGQSRRHSRRAADDFYAIDQPHCREVARPQRPASASGAGR